MFQPLAHVNGVAVSHHEQSAWCLPGLFPSALPEAKDISLKPSVVSQCEAKEDASSATAEE